VKPDIRSRGTPVPRRFCEPSAVNLASLHVQRRVERPDAVPEYSNPLSYRPPLPSDPDREDPPPEAKLPSLFDALKQQLGLRLEAQKGPVEYLVVEHVEKPAAGN
jgi:uncharacterized protein (TIGR03435 family)